MATLLLATLGLAACQDESADPDAFGYAIRPQTPVVGDELVLEAQEGARQYVWQVNERLYSSRTLRFCLDAVDTLVVALNAQTGDETIIYAADTLFVTPHAALAMPSVFSPNGDGENDTWQPLPTGSPRPAVVQWRVYDRWGQNVAGGEGEPDWAPAPSVPQGVYVYTVQLAPYGCKKEEEVLTGSLTLLR